MNLSRSSSFMRSTLPACVQKESCTPAKSRPGCVCGVCVCVGWGGGVGGGGGGVGWGWGGGGWGGGGGAVRAGGAVWVSARMWGSRRAVRLAGWLGAGGWEAADRIPQLPSVPPHHAARSPSSLQAMTVSIMWLESMEWM